MVESGVFRHNDDRVDVFLGDGVADGPLFFGDAVECALWSGTQLAVIKTEQKNPDDTCIIFIAIRVSTNVCEGIFKTKEIPIRIRSRRAKT